MATQKHGASTNHDQDIWNRLEKLCAKRDTSEILESFPVYSRRVNIGRFIAHYELFRMIRDLPGCIFDVGVYRGVSLFTWAKLLEIFSPGDRTRLVFGFDNFKGFENITSKDGPEVPQYDKIVGGWNAGEFYNELLELVDIFHIDSMLPRAPRIKLIEGDITKTAPDLIKQMPGLRVSLLHLDIDLYEPTLAALEAFYPLVVKGGLIVFDEYGLKEWNGESTAVEEYFGRAAPVIKKFGWSSLPGGYFIKE